MGEDIIICRQVDDYSLASLCEHILKYLINEIGRKVRIVAEEITMKMLNGVDIDQIRLYVKKHCGHL